MHARQGLEGRAGPDHENQTIYGEISLGSSGVCSVTCIQKLGDKWALCGHRTPGLSFIAQLPSSLNIRILGNRSAWSKPSKHARVGLTDSHLQIFSPFSIALDTSGELRLPSPRPLAALLCSDCETAEDTSSVLQRLAEEALSLPDPSAHPCRPFLQVTLPYPNQDELSDCGFDWIEGRPVFDKWLRGDHKFRHLINNSTPSQNYRHILDESPELLIKTLNKATAKKYIT